MSQVSSQGELYPCPWKDCQGMYPLVGSRASRVVKVHTVNGKPCPGGGFNVDKPIIVEAPKMVDRARGLGWM